MTSASKNYSLSQVGNIISTDANGAITSLNTSTTGANLGAVGNVHITGGSDGQVLTTNGSGNLSWSTASTSLTYGNVEMSGGVVNVAGNIYQSNAQIIMTFTLPSAGVWDVTYIVRCCSTTGSFMCIGLWNTTNASDVAIPGSELIHYIGVGSIYDLRVTLTGRRIITTTGSTTCTVRGWSPYSGPAWSAQSNDVGRTTVTWVKIG